MFNINDITIKLLEDTVQRLPDIPDEDYFGEPYKKYISNSLMSLINPAQGGSPSKFITGFKAKKSGGALELGTAVHRMLLEKGKFFIDDAVKPSAKIAAVMEAYMVLLVDYPEKEAIRLACIEADYYASNVTQTRIDNVLKDGADYLAHLYDKLGCSDCITLTQEHKDKLDRCLASVKDNKLITELLEGPTSEKLLKFNEDVFIMDVEANVPSKDDDDFECKTTKMSIKVKIDNWSIDLDKKIVTLNDLKTTGKSIADFSGEVNQTMSLDGEVYNNKTKGSFETFHYYRQISFYMMVLKAYVKKTYGATEEDGWTFESNMLVVETNEPHYSHVFKVGPRWMNLGDYEYMSLLKRIAYHTTYGYDSFVNINLNNTTVLW